MRIGQFFSDVLGAPLANGRWSWGARDRNRDRIYLRVWDDEIDRDRQTVQVLWKSIRHGPGYNERSRHLDEMKAGVPAFGIVCTALSVTSQGSRKIARFDGERLILLSDPIERGQTVWAKVKGSVPLDEVLHVEGAMELQRDLNAILASKKLTVTERQALVSARIGQGYFRAQVLASWGQRCAVTGSGIASIVRASHIKPWRACSNEERLDPQNGLPLVAHMDALFDAGFITFDQSGRLLPSSSISESELKLLGIAGASLRAKPASKSLAYLRYHRAHVFR